MTRASHATLAALLLASAAISPVNAADGFYIGGGVGSTSVEESVNGGTLDADDTAWKGFIGWRFDVIPLIDLAVEGAYTEFGKPSQNVGGQEARLKLSGPSLAGLLIFPLGPIDLFGKAGWLWWDSERTIGGVSSERTGSDSFWGAGIGFRIWKIGVRAEYERFQINDVDRMELWSLSALFQF